MVILYLYLSNKKFVASSSVITKVILVNIPGTRTICSSVPSAFFISNLYFGFAEVQRLIMANIKRMIWTFFIFIYTENFQYLK